ncbi:MAG: hypothetical protein AAF849_19105 [Bacteroidota bacterium]
MHKNNLDYDIITDENKCNFPVEFQEAHEFLKQSENGILFEDQYYASLEYIIKRKLKATYTANANISIRDFILETLRGLPPTIPAKKLKEVLDMMFAYWNKISQSTAATA